jgi:hypothetical protein
LCKTGATNAKKTPKNADKEVIKKNIHSSWGTWIREIKCNVKKHDKAENTAKTRNPGKPDITLRNMKLQHITHIWCKLEELAQELKRKFSL